jgi:hypothetical protein
MGGGHLPPYLGSGLVINLACKACSTWVVDIYHHIWAVDWCSIWLARPVRYGWCKAIWLARPVRHGWWTSTTIFVQWTGGQFALWWTVHRIRARSVRHGWWTSTTIFGQWTGDQFGLQGLFNMGGGHLPPYLGSGLVINLACKACSIWVVDIYHHIWAVDW